jgi:hypothetical protein
VAVEVAEVILELEQRIMVVAVAVVVAVLFLPQQVALEAVLVV